MAKGSLFRGQKNGGYCNIHKGINFNNSARGCSCLFLFIRKQRAQKIKAEGPAASRVRGTAPAPGPACPTPRRPASATPRSEVTPTHPRKGRRRPGDAREEAERAPAASPRPLPNGRSARRRRTPHAGSAPARCRPARLGRPDSPGRRAGAERGARGAARRRREANGSAGGGPEGGGGGTGGPPRSAARRAAPHKRAAPAAAASRCAAREAAGDRRQGRDRAPPGPGPASRPPVKFKIARDPGRPVARRPSPGRLPRARLPAAPPPPDRSPCLGRAPRRDPHGDAAGPPQQRGDTHRQGKGPRGGRQPQPGNASASCERQSVVTLQVFGPKKRGKKTQKTTKTLPAPGAERHSLTHLRRWGERCPPLRWLRAGVRVPGRRPFPALSGG